MKTMTAEQIVSKNLDRAVTKLDAVRMTWGAHDGDYAHYDDGMGRWYIVSAQELVEYCDYLDHEDEQISGDAYSHWCAGNTSVEMPRGWAPEADESTGDLVVLESMPEQHRSSHRAAGNFGTIVGQPTYALTAEDLGVDAAEEVAS
jgi:hypothetical protein